jgi:competence protein ComEC
LASWLAALPGATQYLAGPGPAAVALFYAGALAAVALPRPWRWGAGGALGAAGLALWLAWSGPPPPDGALRAWVLDVGHGSATVLRLPRGQVVVVDGGGWAGSEFDFGRQVVAPFLWSRGFVRVEVLVCSHRDTDHSGGLPFVLRWFRPRQVWTNGAPPDGGWYGRLLAEAARQRVPVLGPKDIARVERLGGARVRLLWPPPGGGHLAGLGRNDRCLWLGLGLGSAWLWLPGDNGPKVERAVLAGLPSRGRQVLLAPHHGAKNSLTPELLARLRPQAVLFSSACWGRWASPSREALARAREAGAGIYGTNWQGCLNLATNGGPWRITPYLNPSRQCRQAEPPQNKTRSTRGWGGGLARARLLSGWSSRPPGTGCGSGCP